MTERELLEALRAVKSGDMTPESFVEQVKLEPFQDLGEVKLDHHRALRRGVPEIIYCPGKSDEQLRAIATALNGRKGTFIFSRISAFQVDLIRSLFPEVVHHERARIAAIVDGDEKRGLYSGVTVVAAGSSDVPVAEEAAVTAEYLGCEVRRIFDVGVAGIHRLLSYADVLMSSKVIVAVAGMEGALPGVVAGLVGCPVIAVPTSIGYGANFGGLSALLTMINTCATGVTVVNIDNGLGAGYTAGTIARQSR